MKRLDNTALAYIKAWPNFTQYKLADQLHAQGYTSNSGKRLNNTHISEFMNANGIRRATYHSKNTKTTQAVKVNNQEQDAVALIQLVAQTMPPDKAMQVIKALTR